MKPTNTNIEGWDHFWELYKSGVWEPGTKAFMKRFLKPGDLFVDIGAWIGPTALWAVECGAHVIAIEPDPVAVDELLLTVPNCVEVYPVAVAPEPGTVLIGANPKEGGELGDSMSRVVASDGFPVEAMTLSQILNGRIPTMVKIDVEGYETELCPAIMPWLGEVGAIVQISCHGAFPKWEKTHKSILYPDDLWGDIKCW